MEISDRELVAQAVSGDEEAFSQLVLRHQTTMKSYLYRLTACREDADDLTQEVWINVFTRLGSLTGSSSMRTWLFTVATDLAIDHQRVKARWPVDAQDKAHVLAIADPEIPDIFHQTHWESPRARYEMREHVDFCFTCIMKTLPLDQHLAFVLGEIYDFTTGEVAEILGRAWETVDHLQHQARTTMNRIFAQRCALINQQGTCHLCTELNSLFNPHQAAPQELAKLDLARAAQDRAGQDLFALRTALVKSIDPLNAAGTNLHEVIMRLVRQTSRTE